MLQGRGRDKGRETLGGRGGDAGGKTLGVDLLSLKCIVLSVYLLAVTQKQGDEIINDPINTYLMSTR